MTCQTKKVGLLFPIEAFLAKNVVGKEIPEHEKYL